MAQTICFHGVGARLVGVINEKAFVSSLFQYVKLLSVHLGQILPCIGIVPCCFALRIIIYADGSAADMFIPSP